MTNQVLTTAPSADDDDISFGAAAAEEEDILIGVPGEQRLFSPKGTKEAPKSDSTFKPTSPIMGGIEQIDINKYMAWTGGKPTSDWTGLDLKALKEASKPMQYRATGNQDVKSYTFRTSGLKSKFDKISDIEDFCTNVWNHLVECGMDTISYLPDPAEPSVMKSVVCHHGRYNEEYTAQQSELIQLKWDKFDRANDVNAKVFLLNSLKPVLRKSVQQTMEDTDTFATIWIQIMRKINQNSAEYFKSVEKNIKACTPLKFTCQNMDEWCTEMRTHVNLLVDSGVYDHKLSEEILDLAMLAGGDDRDGGNQDWKAALRPMKEELEAKIEEIGLYVSRLDQSKAMIKAKLSPEHILKKVETTYTRMMNKDKWPPAKNPVDSAAPSPSKFGNSSYFASPSLRPNGQSPPKTKSVSFDPYTKPGKFNKKKTFSPSKQRSTTKSWKVTPPKSGEPQTKKVNDKTWHWCQKCNYGKGRWSTTHGTKEHQSKPKSKPQSTPQPSAHVTNVDSDSSQLDVWCTAIEVQPQPTKVFLPLMFCILLGIIVVLSGIKAFSQSVPTTQLTARCVYGHLPYFPPAKHFKDVVSKLNTFMDFYNDPSYVVQQSLGCITVTWMLFFLAYGSVPFDWFLEQFLSGGRCIQNAFILNQSSGFGLFMKPIRFLSAQFVQHFDLVHGLMDGILDILCDSEYLWFIAPFTWMITAYLSIFLTRRNCIEYHMERHQMLLQLFKGERLRANSHNTFISKKRWSITPQGPSSFKKSVKPFKKPVNKHKQGLGKKKPVKHLHNKKKKNAVRHPPPSAPPLDHHQLVNDMRKHFQHERNRSKHKACVAQQEDVNQMYESTPSNGPTLLPNSALEEINQKFNFKFSFGPIFSSTSSEPSIHDLPPLSCIPVNEDGRQNQPLYTYISTPIMKTFKAGSSLLHQVLLSAPAKAVNNMKPKTKFNVIWDTGASVSISPCKEDFIEFSADTDETTLVGISNGLKVKGSGIVEWCVMDMNGGIRKFKVRALYVPACNVRLLRPHDLTEQFNDETITVVHNGLRLSGSEGDYSRAPVLATISNDNNLPMTVSFTDKGWKQAAMALNATISVVHEANQNLTQSEKCYMQWHWRLGHPGFNKLMYLFRSGVLSNTESSRRMIKGVLNNITSVPKCAACMYGKQRRLPSPGKTSHIIKDRRGVLKENNLNPGDETSIDHFFSSVRGRLFNSRGKTREENMYCGGLLAVDQASNYVFVYCQRKLTTHETLRAKEQYERHCRDHGVINQKYLSDKGSAFTSKEFTEHLKELRQIIRFAGVGSHHQNGHVERHIGTIMSVARTMMLHAAIHWPDMADPALWPMAVHHATFLFNHLPDPATGFSPFDLFSRSRWPLKNLHDMHVWGCPVYVLEKTLSDGKKIPRWKPRSTRCVYMGVAPDNATNTPLVLDPTTGSITPKFHVVFDDSFSTVSSNGKELPDFNSDAWYKLFGDTNLQYHSDESIETVPTIQETMTPQQHYLNQDRAWASDIKYAPEPIPRNVTSGISTSLDPELQREYPSASLPNVHDSSTHDSTPLNEASELSPDKTTVSVPSPIKTNVEIDPTPIVEEPEYLKSMEQELKHVTKNESPVKLRRSTRAKKEPERLDMVPTKKSYVNKARVVTDIQPSINQDTKYIYEPSIFDDFYKTEIQHAYAASKSKSDPDTYTWDEVMSSPDRDEWTAASDIEIKQLVEDRDTWEIVPISNAGNAKILPTTWVFRLKRHPDGTPKKRKARLCIRGDLQEGLSDVFAPVVEFSSVRFFLAFVMIQQWTACAIDFVNAFCQTEYPELMEPVWVHPPRGYYHDLRGKYVLKLNKSMYGLRDAPRLWFENLFKHLLSPDLGFTQSPNDQCLLFRSDMMIIVYVDDMGVAAQREELIDELVSYLCDKGLVLEREGTFQDYLGIRFNTLPNGSVHMTQSGLIRKIIKATGMESCNPNKLPAQKACLGKDLNGEPMNHNEFNYRSVVGMLLYLSGNTRPDITFAVSQVARFTHNPKKTHATAVKMIVRYLSGTADKGIIVPRFEGDLTLRVYVDADFAGLYNIDPPEDPDSAKSRTGFIIFLGTCPLIWKSFLQSKATMSTLEAEYSALSSSLRVALPIIQIARLAVSIVEVPTKFRSIFQCACIVFEDNNGALILAKTQRTTSRTKYFNVEWHFFWQHVKDGTLEVERIATVDQVADYLTKGCGREIFQRIRKTVQGW